MKELIMQSQFPEWRTSTVPLMQALLEGPVTLGLPGNGLGGPDILACQPRPCQLSFWEALLYQVCWPCCEVVGCEDLLD